MKRKVLESEKDYDKSNYYDEIPLLKIKSKKTIRKKIERYKDIFVYSSVLTLVSFLISISILILSFLKI